MYANDTSHQKPSSHEHLLYTSRQILVLVIHCFAGGGSSPTTNIETLLCDHARDIVIQFESYITNVRKRTNVL